jgi:hypothetical protein
MTSRVMTQPFIDSLKP